MKKVLMIRRNPTAVTDGTVNYCRSLRRLYDADGSIEVLPIVDYATNYSRYFKYTYDKEVLTEAFAEADIVHVNGYTALGTVQALRWAHRLGKRVVYTAHWHPFENLSHPWLGRCFFQLFVRPAIRRCADVVVAINDEDYRFFSSFHPHVVKIPHWYRPAPVTQPRGRKADMLLFVGRVDDDVKGIEHLYALPEHQYEIHCVGNGRLRPRADFTQHVNVSDDELNRLYAEAAVVVIPSKYEAFSYVALEALSLGTPVVMSDRVRIADHLRGVSGYSVFSYGDVADFESKIRQTIGTTVDVGAITARFSPERIKQEYDKVYAAQP